MKWPAFRLLQVGHRPFPQAADAWQPDDFLNRSDLIHEASAGMSTPLNRTMVPALRKPNAAVLLALGARFAEGDALHEAGRFLF